MPQSIAHTATQSQSYTRIRSAALHVLATRVFGRGYVAFIAPNGYYTVETESRAIAARSLPGLMSRLESM